MDLSNMIRKDSERLTTWVEYEDGFKVELRFLPKSKFQHYMTTNRTQSWDKKTHQRVERLDNEALKKIFVKNHLLGWQGLTVRLLSTLVPIEDSVAELDPSTEIEYTPSNALAIIEAAMDLETFLLESAMEIANFQDVGKSEAQADLDDSPDGS